MNRKIIKAAKQPGSQAAKSEEQRSRGQEVRLVNESSFNGISLKQQNDNSHTSIHPVLHTSKLAFTLAEVLITLGIIGVVSAMTLPSVIHKYKIKSLETSFKKSYSLLSQALLKMKADDVYLDKNVGGNNNATFQQYFKIINKYNIGSRDLTHLGYKNSEFMDHSDSIGFNQSGHQNGAFVVNNGMIIFQFVTWATNSDNSPNMEFIIDTNGFKGPNKFGYDVFYFQIAPDNKLLPSDQTAFNTDSLSDRVCCNLSTPKRCNPNNDNGIACAYYALKNQNPWDETKGYWESLK